MLSSAESRGSGLQWSNLFSRGEPDDPLTMGAVWGMFLLDCLIFALITLYMDKVAPGKFGVARPWYFPVMGLVRNGNVTTKEVSTMEVDNDMFETEPSGEAGGRVSHLKKEFPRWGQTPVRAVRDVSFAAFPGEITALLGHNGAGKTTTMSVLTGLFSPTSGEAMVGGHSIRDGMDEVRQSLGLCPQHNMLFEDLTVREHLVFFGMLKGMTKSAAEDEGAKYISMLNLEPKRNVNVTTLSGGMKRKVNLGIALIGDSKVDMSSTIHPCIGSNNFNRIYPGGDAGRANQWYGSRGSSRHVGLAHLLEEGAHHPSHNALYGGRSCIVVVVVVVVVHDDHQEADVLGDRIAIMASGRVQCCGSPFFLKQKLGTGYTLEVEI